MIEKREGIVLKKMPRIDQVQNNNNHTDRMRPGRKHLKIMSPTAASDKQYVGLQGVALGSGN